MTGRLPRKVNIPSCEGDTKLAQNVWRTCALRRRGSMPFTVGFLQQQAKHGWGRWLPEKRAAAAIRELQRQKILTPIGFYRGKRHGYRVTLYLLPQGSSSVRKTRCVKWWQHPLFGFPEKPEGYSDRLLRRLCG